MFYSQTFLARKGPLGTVWTAAHLQNRLKKSQYTATNIPETVDLIMFPEVPLALRMSGHLLLGVVRIYSKKVDYLFRDCNLLSTWLAKAFVSTQVDLPEDARQAPIEAVTLPQTLNLDDFALEDETLERIEFDNHIRSEEDITLTDQIPTGVDPYVAITFDEDIIPESTPMDVDQPTEPVSEHHVATDVEMAYETGPTNEPDTETYGPRNDTEEIPEFQDTRTEVHSPRTNSPGTVPEIERGRDAAPDISPGFVAEQEIVRVEGTTESLDDKEPTPTVPIIHEQVLDSGRLEHPVGSPPRFARSEEERAIFEHASPQLVLQPSPLPQPQARPRKRKQFDKVTVLTNKEMKERLENPSDTLRKRQKLPSTTLGVWRLNNQSKKDQMFNEPLFTGLSDVLRSVYEKDCVASKPYLALSVETSPEPTSVSSPPTREAETEMNPTSPVQQPTVPDSTNPESPVPDSTNPEAHSPQTFNNDDIGIERLRDGGSSDYMMSSPPRFSLSKTDDFATTQPGTWEMRSYGTEPSTSRNQPGTWETTRSYGTETSISTNPEDQTGLRSLGLPDIPEMADEELYFLEVGSNTPEKSPAASQDSNGLSGRTRALAQYLKQRSSSRSPTSSDASGDLSLSKILTGKTRKLAARMFYETLVLKSRGLIDVQQDQPYSDIALILKPALFSKV